MLVIRTSIALRKREGSGLMAQRGHAQYTAVYIINLPHAFSFTNSSSGHTIIEIRTPCGISGNGKQNSTTLGLAQVVALLKINSQRTAYCSSIKIQHQKFKQSQLDSIIAK